MPAESPSKLDDQELLHLAIEASSKQRHGDAIQYLKEAAATSKRNAKVHFLLGAEHAQIGLFDRAIEDMRTALEIDPSLVPARFQLGLIFLTRGNVQEASAIWNRLDKLAESDPYLHFKRGLERLVQDDFSGCEESLARGMKLNTSNPALNQDMQRVLDEVAAKRSVAAPGGPDAPEQPGHVLLSAYTRTQH
jgi:Flp pilus assembly protein TadD